MLNIKDMSEILLLVGFSLSTTFAYVTVAVMPAFIYKPLSRTKVAYPVYLVILLPCTVLCIAWIYKRYGLLVVGEGFHKWVDKTFKYVGKINRSINSSRLSRLRLR